AEAILHRLRERFTVDNPLVVVLEDSDRIADEHVFREIEWLARAGAGRLRVVLGCRSDPALPLHRWRVYGDLAELRADQLAFTVPETAELLSAHNVHLPYSA